MQWKLFAFEELPVQLVEFRFESEGRSGYISQGAKCGHERQSRIHLVVFNSSARLGSACGFAEHGEVLILSLGLAS